MHMSRSIILSCFWLLVLSTTRVNPSPNKSTILHTTSARQPPRRKRTKPFIFMSSLLAIPSMSQLPPSPAVTLGGTITPVSAGAITAQPDTYALSNQASLAPTASNAISPGIATVTISGNDSAPQNHTGTSIPNNSPAGGIIMTKPPQSSTSFYKIAANEIVTFGWNFTFIAQNPDNITVSAICDNGNTYPVGPTNGVIPGTATEVAWDLHSWQVNNPGMPLAQGTYTLTMWDNRGKSAVPMPGLMRPYNNLRFALYTPQLYIPLDGGWTCSDCHNSGMLSASTHPAFVGFVVSALVIFISGLNLLHSNVH